MENEEKQKKEERAVPFGVKREFRDALFRRLFSEESYATELIYALSGREILPRETIEPIMLFDVIARYYRNDLSFRVGNEFIVMVEHQSTHDRYLPLRMLNYAAQTYMSFLERKGNGRALLPRVKLYVVYHGKQALPDELTLSGISVPCSEGYDCIECRIKVVDIRRNAPELKRSRALFGYSELVRAVDNALSVGKNTNEAASEAVRYCLENGHLVDFLKLNAREVVKMIQMEYNYEADMRKHREDGFEDGLEQGLEKGIKKGLEQGIEQGIEKVVLAMIDNGLSDEQIAKLTKLPVEVIRKIG